MGKKKSIDPGLKYIQEINFDRIRGKYGLNDRFIRVFGKERAKNLFEEREKYEDGSLEFYNFMNSEYEISKAFSEAYDADIIRKSCNFIDKNASYFGKRILEIGCGNGYITGFLGKRFPESTIFAVDRSENAINIAKQNMNKFGVNNVEFIVSDIYDLSGEYDTIISSRTVQEIVDFENYVFEGEFLMYLLAEYSQRTEKYAEKICSLLAEGGNLLSIERINNDPLLYGWMNSLNNVGCGVIDETFSTIKCEEVEDINTFQGLVCKKGLSVDEAHIYILWWKSMNIIVQGKQRLESWDALVYEMENAGELIKGFYILTPDGDTVGRFMYYFDADDRNQVMLLHAIGGTGIELVADGTANMEQVILNLDTIIKKHEDRGFSHRIITDEEASQYLLKRQ